MAVHSGIWFMILVLKAFHHSAQAVDERCKNVTCPELLTCKFPKTSIIIPDPNESCCEKLVCTCKGTKNGKASSSNSQRQYYNTQLRYTNCTLIDGNLELVGFHSYASAVDFTKHIEEVTGYVFIYHIYADYIDLSSLRLIRGSTKYVPLSGCDVINSSKAQNAKGESLYVNSNYKNGSTEVGLKELRMQSLTEITEGNVSFVGNDLLCYVNTIAWEKDIFMSKQQSVTFSYSKKAPPKCQNCASVCKSCWGNTTDLCQRITKSICEQCGEEDPRCFRKQNGNIQCCDGQCAAGCFGRGPRKCYACKNLNEKGKCVKYCVPTEAKDPITGEVKKVVKKYQYGRYCIEKCPANVPQSSVFCQTFCEEGSFDYDNNICTKCNGGKCQNICYGLGLNHGPLKGQTYINANNIKHFNKNCTIIEGSLGFHWSTFQGDDYCNVAKLNVTAFQVFENVEEITGFLVFETWRYPNICVFKNLRKIRGKVLYYQKYALAVYTGNSDLRELCFNSLNTIGNGGVAIRSNPKLCYSGTINWNLLKISQGVYQVPFSKVIGNQRASCPSCALQCNENDGCWGKSNTQCIRCKDYTDLTDNSGNVAPLWINVNGSLYPGHNVTTCVEKCDFAKGVYASAEKTCLPCDPQCEHTCIGPGPTNCTKCKNKKLNDTCVEECDPENYFATKNNTCESCGSGCIDGGCAGPLDEYNLETGCLACHFSYDAKTSRHVYRGAQCNQCHATKIRKECQHGCYIINNTLPYNCLILPGPNYGLMVGVPVTLGICIIGLCFLFYFYRNKKNMTLMKRTIEERMFLS